MILSISSADQLPDVARQALALAGERRIWLLEGEMGAGKTTFIKAICRELGVTEPVQSPTFSLVNEYRTAAGQTLYHFDFYRLRSEAEALDIGVEEYFDSGRYCFLEWPSRILGLLPSGGFQISINLDGQNGRTFRLTTQDG